MALATLSIDLVARLAGLQEGLDKSTRLLQKQAADVDRLFSGVRSSAAAIGGALVGAFAGVSLVAFARNVTDGLDALNDLKDATGASIENISGLEDVALRTGTSFETASSALIKFNKVLLDAKPGSDNAEILKAIGLNAEELKRIDPAEALQQTAVALAAFADDGEKARVVQTLFGKSTAEVAPLLKDLAEKGKLVATVTTEQALAAEEFNKQLFNLQKNTTDAARSLASVLLPAINNLFDAYKRFDGLPGITKAIFGEDEASQLSKRADSLQADAKRVGALITQLDAALTRNPGNTQVKDRLEQARLRLAFLTTQSAALSEQLKAKANELSGTGDPTNYSNEGRTSTKPSVRVPGDKPGSAKAQKATNDFVFPELPESLKAIQARIDALPSARIAELREQLQQLISIRTRDGGGATDEAILQIEEELAKFNPAAQEAAANTERLNQLLNATSSAKIAEANRDLDLLRANLAKTGNTDQYAEAVKARFGIPEQAFKAVDDFQVLADQAARNIQDSLGTGLKQVLSGEFKSIGGLFKNLITDLIAQAASAQIGKYLLGDFGSTGNIGGLIGSIGGALFSANGNAFDLSGRITAFERGGIVNGAMPFSYGGGKLGVMGEAGPEGILPLRRGKDGKLGVIAQGGSNSSTVINNISVGAGVSRGEVVSLLSSYGAQLKAEILASQRGGGAFAR